MGKDHTNIRSDLPYEFPKGKCADDFSGEKYTKIMESDAPQLDMGQAPMKGGKSGKGKKEKSY